MVKKIIYEELIKTFTIDENGILFRRLENGKLKKLDIKRNSKDGYFRLKWKGVEYRAHRLMYCLYHQIDVDPSLVVDHINANKIDNRKENLRLVSHRENQQNRIEHRNNRLPGTKFDKRCSKFQARIRINNKQIHLGMYDTEKEAHETYLTACTMTDKPIEEIQSYFNIKTRPKSHSFS